MDEEETIVIFRKDKYGVFALFPELRADFQGNITSYQSIGQHSSADYGHCIATSKPATEEECRDLFEELIKIGYKLKVRKRAHWKYFQ